jgi:hypothetical protein
MSLLASRLANAGLASMPRTEAGGKRGEAEAAAAEPYLRCTDGVDAALQLFSSTRRDAAKQTMGMFLQRKDDMFFV